jgi:hypothetical protein
MIVNSFHGCRRHSIAEKDDIAAHPSRTGNDEPVEFKKVRDLCDALGARVFVVLRLAGKLPALRHNEPNLAARRKVDQAKRALQRNG